MGRDQSHWLTDLQFFVRRCVATPITHMNDDNFVREHPIIDQVGIARRGKHANTGNIGFPPKARIARASSWLVERICLTTAVAALVLCEAMYW